MKIFSAVSPRLWAFIAPIAVGLIFAFWWSRRSEDDEEDDEDLVLSRPLPYEASKPSKTSVEVPIPASAVGWVIGRGGKNIRQIELQTGCRVKVQDSSPAEKGDSIVTLFGHPDQVKEAEEKIHAVVKEKMQKEVGEKAEKFSVELTVPSRAVGRVIGRQGQTIRGIERSSGARLKIEGSSNDAEDDHLCVICGTPEQVEMARTFVLEKIEEEFTPRSRDGRSGRSDRSQSRTALPTDQAKNEVQTPQIDWSSVRVRLPATLDFIPVYVSALWDVDHFWVQQLSAESPLLEALVTRMTDDYSRDASNGVLSSVQAGDVCAAPFDIDDRWYRVRVMEIQGDDLEVIYLDYGDLAKVQRNQVKALKREYVDLPFQAVHCRLAGAKSAEGERWSEECGEDFERLTYCAQWKAIMLKVVHDPCSLPASLLPDPVSVELVDTNNPAVDVNLLDELVKLGHARSPAVSTVGEPSSQEEQEPGESIIDRGDAAAAAAVAASPMAQFARLPPSAEGSLIPVSVTAVKDPHQFTVQISDESNAVEKLCDELTEFYSGLGSDELCLKNVEPGTICCATFAHDETWHRAKVLEQLDPTILSVQYLDYGDVANVQVEHVKQLKEEYLRLPFQAISCCMVNIKPVDGENWTVDAISNFECVTHLGSWQQMLLNIVPVENEWSIPSVELFDPDNEGMSVAEKMVSDGVAVWASTVVAENGAPVPHEGRGIHARSSLTEPADVAVEKMRSQMEEQEKEKDQVKLPVWKNSNSLPRMVAANFSRSRSEQKSSCNTQSADMAERKERSKTLPSNLRTHHKQLA